VAPSKINQSQKEKWWEKTTIDGVITLVSQIS
jgi:hypothetical protein